MTFRLLLCPPGRNLYGTKAWSDPPLCPQHLAQGLAGAGIVVLTEYFVELKNGVFGEFSIL